MRLQTKFVDLSGAQLQAMTQGAPERRRDDAAHHSQLID